jgi:hypothetical protein
VSSITGYAFPWDYIDDDEATARAASLGVEVVALAAVYHATRVATPLHPTRRITEVPHSAAYFPIRDAVWRSHRLRPRAPEVWIGPDSFEHARSRLEREGLLVDGWIVLTHDDDLGPSDQELFVRSAYGETYSYALCPRADDVREYCRTLVQEVLRSGTLRGVIFEACGPMGVDHGSTHDKVAMANWSSVERQLLSLCFCRACKIGLSDAGVDPVDLAHRVRGALADGATTMEDALGDVTADVATYRQSVSTDLQMELIEAAREVQPDTTVTVHASANPWATGSFPTSTSKSLASATCAVANCWDPDSAERDLAGLGAMTTNLGAYLRLDHDWAHLENDLTRYAELGVNELHLYHLGLLSQSSADTAARMIGEWKSGVRVTNIDQIEEALDDG